jgi:hypothetical protein
MMVCPECNECIQGQFISDGWTEDDREYRPPRYCHKCGAPYPWTAAALDELDRIAHGAAALNDSEKAELAEAFVRVVREEPGYQSRAVRAHELLMRAGKEAGALAKAIAVDVFSETVIKLMFP